MSDTSTGPDPEEQEREMFELDDMPDSEQVSPPDTDSPPVPQEGRGTPAN